MAVLLMVSNIFYAAADRAKQTDSVLPTEHRETKQISVQYEVSISLPQLFALVIQFSALLPINEPFRISAPLRMCFCPEVPLF